MNRTNDLLARTFHGAAAFVPLFRSRRRQECRRSVSLFLLALAVLSTSAWAQDDGGRPRVKLDPKRIINESQHFLKEREPDLTAEEDALYAKAGELLSTKPALALKMLEDLGAETKSKEPPSPAFDLLLGNVYYASGAIDQAEAKYLSAVARYPNFLRAWTNLGVLYHAKNEYRKAIPCFAKSVTLGARESTTFGMMANCLERTGDAVGAEVAYIQALAGDPGNVSWMEGLLRVFLDAKQYARAEVMVRNLIQVQPREPKYWLTYANIMAATERKLEAIALLEQTLSTGIAGDEERMELAGLYADEQLISEAIQAYGRIKVTVQTLGEVKTFQFARILISGSEWDRAQALLNELKPKLAGQSLHAWLQIQADLHASRKKWAAARRVLDELLQMDPMDGRALVSLGRAYAAEGDDVHATLTFETAAQTREGARPASIELANIELRNRHYEKSAAYLEQALGLGKSQDLEDILARVRTLVPSAAQKES